MNNRQIWYDTIFEKVKMRDVLTQYVQRTDKPTGRIHCPLHGGHDDNFSYNSELFQCWVCGETGNVISFVAKLFGLTNYEAARKIDADFGIGVFGKKPTLLMRKKAKRKEQERVRKLAIINAIDDEYDTLCIYRRCIAKYPLLAERYTERIDYRLDELMEQIDANT